MSTTTGGDGSTVIIRPMYVVSPRGGEIGPPLLSRVLLNLANRNIFTNESPRGINDSPRENNDSPRYTTCAVEVPRPPTITQSIITTAIGMVGEKLWGRSHPEF